MPPTRFIVLMHPAITSRLLAQLGHQTILRFRLHQQYTLANGSSPPIGNPSVKRAIIDTHFHLDSFPGRQGRSLSDMESSKSKPLLVSIPFAIANYVFPDKWSHLSEHVRAHPRLRITLGVHPHMITESQVASLFGRLEGLLGQYPEPLEWVRLAWTLLRRAVIIAVTMWAAVVGNLRDSANSCGLPSSLRNNLIKSLF